MSAISTLKSDYFTTTQFDAHTPAGCGDVVRGTPTGLVVHHTSTRLETHYNASTGAWEFVQLRWAPARASMHVVTYEHATKDEIHYSINQAVAWLQPSALADIPSTWQALGDGEYGLLLARRAVCAPPTGWARVTGDNTVTDHFEPVDWSWPEGEVAPSHMVLPVWTPGSGVRVDLADNLAMDTTDGYPVASLEALIDHLNDVLARLRKEKALAA